MKNRGWITKELAAAADMSKRTLDTYLDARAVIPSADNAVKIAQALGVTVEYLVTGKAAGAATLEPEIRGIVEKLQVLDAGDRKAVEGLIDTLSQRYLPSSTAKGASTG